MKIFLSFRRQDTAAQAGRLGDLLFLHFGQDAVLTTDVSAGGASRTTIEEAIGQADVVLALIGNRFLDARDDSGERQIDDPSDFVRIELESAFATGAFIIPVLIDGARMPYEDQFPPSLAGIARRQAVGVGLDPHFRSDADRLIKTIESWMESSGRRTADAASDIGRTAQAAVFISHSVQDRDWVEQQIVQLLTRNSIPTWYSRNSISTASQWEREILRGLESCPWFLLVASPRAAKSEWVKDELNWAMHNRPTRIVPVVMEPCNLWDFHIRLPRIHHVDFADDVDAARKSLIQRFTADTGD